MGKRRTTERTEFGMLLEDLTLKSGKSSFIIAKEMGWSSAHLSKAKSGKANLTERFITDVENYFVSLGIEESDLSNRLRVAAKSSQFSIERMRTNSKPSDRRLNRFKFNLQEPLIKIKVQISSPKGNVELITAIIQRLENSSRDILKAIMELLS